MVTWPWFPLVEPTPTESKLVHSSIVAGNFTNLTWVKSQLKNSVFIKWMNEILLVKKSPDFCPIVQAIKLQLHIEIFQFFGTKLFASWFHELKYFPTWIFSSFWLKCNKNCYEFKNTNTHTPHTPHTHTHTHTLTQQTYTHKHTHPHTRATSIYFGLKQTFRAWLPNWRNSISHWKFIPLKS